jgi:lipid-A-disaccharide synthase-like uncharacterized protein
MVVQAIETQAFAFHNVNSLVNVYNLVAHLGLMIFTTKWTYQRFDITFHGTAYLPF